MNRYAYLNGAPLTAADALGLGRGGDFCSSYMEWFTGGENTSGCQEPGEGPPGDDYIVDGGESSPGYASGLLSTDSATTGAQINAAAEAWNKTNSWCPGCVSAAVMADITLKGEALDKASADLVGLCNVDPNCDPAQTYQVSTTERGGAFDILVRGTSLDLATLQEVGWADPISGLFHNGNPSYYLGSPLQLLGVGHAIFDPRGAEFHIDPFGPLNPLHFFGQVFGGWLNGTTRFPSMSCSALGGCGYNGGAN